MASEQNQPAPREKMRNFIKLMSAGVDIVLALVIVLLFSDAGVWVYALAFALLVLAVVDYFVVLPWIFRLGDRKSS
jgi:hypothetical protein